MTTTKKAVPAKKAAPRRRVAPKRVVTRENLAELLAPPNNCRVKEILDQLDDESRKVVEEALAFDKRELPAPRIQKMLEKAGFPTEEIPGVDAIQAHRIGRRPCRCRG